MFPRSNEVEEENGFPLVTGQLPPAIHLKDTKLFITYNYLS